MEQLVVGTAGRDDPVLQKQHAVGLVEQQRAGGHDGGGQPLASRGQATRDTNLGMRVDRARGLDKDQRLGPGEQGPGQREALPLAS